MDNITTQKVVAITTRQLKDEYAPGSVEVATIEKFESRLADNLKLAGIAQVVGRKPRAKTPKTPEGK